MSMQLVDRYLERLDRALADLPAASRRELTAEIRDHVDQALASTPDPTDADVLNVLDRLGDPADIADEARERFGVHRASVAWTDWAAVILLPFGGLLALVLWPLGILAWVAGVGCLLISRVFSGRQKALGVLVIPGGVVLPLILAVRAGSACTSTVVGGQPVTSCTGFSLSPVFGVPLFIALIIAPLIVAVVLASRLQTRAATT